MAWIGRAGVLALAAVGLSGCVAAAAIPAVAGGLAAKKAAGYSASKRMRRPTRAKRGATVPVSRPAELSEMQPETAYAGALPSPTGAAPAASKRAKRRARDGKETSAAMPAAAPLPADLAKMQPGVIYSGSLPSPYAAAPAGDAAPAAKPKAASWTDVGRYVAGLPATQNDSVLLARGSDSNAPAFVSCGSKPRAVLARLETALTPSGSAWRFDARAKQWLEALQTLEVPVVFTSAAPAASRGAIEAAFRTAGLAKLLDLGEVRLGLAPATMPAERAAIGAKNCVVALVGREASDFPNALTPETSPPALADRWGAGWFRIAADGSTDR